MTKSLYGFLKSECIKNPTDTKIKFGRDISGGELLRHVDNLGGYLRSHGVNEGDVVAILLPNIPQAIVSLYAVNSIGAIAYVLHPKTGSKFFSAEIKKLKVKCAILFEKFGSRYKEGLKDVPLVVNCRLSDYLPFPQSLLKIAERRIPHAVEYTSAIKKEWDIDGIIDYGDRPAVYLNSGGTTGVPKTVVLSSHSLNTLAYNVRATARTCDKYVEGMGMLMSLPLFHGFGMGVCVQVGLLVGYVVPVVNFVPSKVIRTMKKYPVHIVVGVPGMLRRLAEKRAFCGDFLKNIRLIFTGGDKVSDRVRNDFFTKLVASGCDTKVMEGYGLSEVGSVACINTLYPDDGSIGQPIHGVDVKIFSDGTVAPDGTVGEIGVCSPSLMLGYLDGEESTFYEHNGLRYLATGDMGYQTEKSIFFVERKKRMIKIGGVNVFPSQVEEEARRFPHVRQACAVRTKWNGKPALKLLVVTDKKGDEYKAKLSHHLAKALIKYAVPKTIERVDSIRTTSVGKADFSYYEEQEKLK